MDQYLVYKIEYKGKVKYIGKATHFDQRKWQHINYQGTSKSPIPKTADKTKINIIPIGYYSTKEEQQAAEEYYIRKFNTINKGWNKIHAKILVEDKPKKERVVKTQEEIHNDKIFHEYLSYEKHLRNIMKEVN